MSVTINPPTDQKSHPNNNVEESGKKPHKASHSSPQEMLSSSSNGTTLSDLKKARSRSRTLIDPNSQHNNQSVYVSDQQSRKQKKSGHEETKQSRLKYPDAEIEKVRIFLKADGDQVVGNDVKKGCCIVM